MAIKDTKEYKAALGKNNKRELEKKIPPGGLNQVATGGDIVSRYKTALSNKPMIRTDDDIVDIMQYQKQLLHHRMTAQIEIWGVTSQNPEYHHLADMTVRGILIEHEETLRKELMSTGISPPNGNLTGWLIGRITYLNTNASSGEWGGYKMNSEATAIQYDPYQTDNIFDIQEVKVRFDFA